MNGSRSSSAAVAVFRSRAEGAPKRDRPIPAASGPSRHSRWPPGECHVRPDRREQPGPDPRNPIQRLKAAKRAIRVSIDDDGACEGEADPREAGNLDRTGPIQVDSLPRGERPRRGEAGIAMGARTPRHPSREELYFAGRDIGPTDP